MASAIPIGSTRALRAELARRGGADAARCFQCATCSAVCDLAAEARTLFPRRQMLLAQWGQIDRLAADPAIWLCHGCNDCSARCPRDAGPGEAMQAIRSLVIERVAAPRLMARLVGDAATNWPILLGGPVLFWALLVSAVSGVVPPRTPLVYADLVPQWMIYSVFIPAALFAAGAAAVAARRAWRAWGAAEPRSGGLLAGLAAVAGEVLDHRRFARCDVARPRRSGHLLLVLGFLGALLTTTLLGIAMDLFGARTPLSQANPIKLVGNASAVLLAVGTGWLVVNRLRGGAGRAAAFDTFFLSLVAAVVLSGIGAELGRLFLAPAVALAVYVLHLGAVLSLFLTFPFSKFAHALYRTLAMAHERLTVERRPS